jgi:hypothetical protein
VKSFVTLIGFSFLLVNQAQEEAGAPKCPPARAVLMVEMKSQKLFNGQSLHSTSFHFTAYTLLLLMPLSVR